MSSKKNQERLNTIDNLNSVFLAVGGLYLGIEKGWFWLVVLCKIYLFILSIGIFILIIAIIILLFKPLFIKKEKFNALKEVEKMK